VTKVKGAAMALAGFEHLNPRYHAETAKHSRDYTKPPININNNNKGIYAKTAALAALPANRQVHFFSQTSKKLFPTSSRLCLRFLSLIL